MWSRQLNGRVMFRAFTCLFFSGLMLIGCTNAAPENSSVSSNLKIDAEGSVLECLGNVEFKPEPGITVGVYEDMARIADNLCGSPADIKKKHSSVGSYPRTDGVILERLTVEFMCQNNALPLGDRIIDVGSGCNKVFENFDAKQD